MGWGGGQPHAPATPTPGKEPVPTVQEAGWPQGRSGQVRKITPPPGFDPRTVQLVVSRCTDYTTWPTVVEVIRIIRS